MARVKKKLVTNNLLHVYYYKEKSVCITICWISGSFQIILLLFDTREKNCFGYTLEMRPYTLCEYKCQLLVRKLCTPINAHRKRVELTYTPWLSFTKRVLCSYNCWKWSMRIREDT